MAWGQPRATRGPRTITVDPNQTSSQVPTGAPGTYTDQYVGTVGYSPTPLNSAYTDTAVAPDPYSGNGGSGSGAYDPTTDPTYQAYVNSLDLSAAQQQADTSRKIGQITGLRDTQLGRLSQQGDITNQNIAGGYEARGLYDSGGRLQDQARQQANQAYQETSIRSNAANQQSDLESALSNALAQIQLRRQGASQGVFT